MTNIEIALKRMGYRQLDSAKSQRWGKPFGFTILTGDVLGCELTMCQWLMATPTNLSLSLWDKNIIPIVLAIPDK
jgi:hypothetical protein